jgi:hypothetical protein
VNSSSSETRTTSWYGTFRGVVSVPASLRVTYKGRNSRTCTQRIEIYRWGDGWVQLTSQSVGTSEVLTADLVPRGTLSRYVRSGEVRVRVRCQTRSSRFTTSGNLLKLVYSSAQLQPEGSFLVRAYGSLDAGFFASFPSFARSYHLRRR